MPFKEETGMKKLTKEEWWKFVDALRPRHRMGGQWHDMHKNTSGYCTDDAPSGGGNFGCRRCDLLYEIEIRSKIAMIPRKKKDT